MVIVEVDGDFLPIQTDTVREHKLEETKFEYEQGRCSWLALNLTKYFIN